MERIHQVTLQLSAYLVLGHDRKHILIREPIPLDDIRAHRWTPLLVYGVTCAVTKIKSVRLAPLDPPRAIGDVLVEQWSNDRWLKGMPDQVVVSRSLAEAAPKLLSTLASLGIAIDTRGNKSVEANRRAIQSDFYSCLPWTNDEPSAYSVDEMNASLIKRLDPRDYHSRWESPTGRELRASWQALTYRPVPELTNRSSELDWTYGPFVEIAFKSVIPPTDSEQLKPVARGSRVFDVTPKPDAQRETLPFEFQHLLAAWPETYAQVARQIGTTESLLRAYVKGRQVLSPSSEHVLMDLLGLRWEDGYPYLEVVGPCLLIGRSIAATDRAYTEVSHGGDLDFAVEVVPNAAEPHPDWHLVIIQTCGVYPSFLLIPRTTADLPSRWADTLINFTRETYRIPRNQYTALLDNILDARATPNGRRGKLINVVRHHRKLFERMQSELSHY